MKKLLKLLKEIDLEYIKSCEQRDLDLDLAVGTTYYYNEKIFSTIRWNEISRKLRDIVL